jgi:hypothetical protein
MSNEFVRIRSKLVVTRLTVTSCLLYTNESMTTESRCNMKPLVVLQIKHNNGRFGYFDTCLCAAHETRRGDMWSVRAILYVQAVAQGVSEALLRRTQSNARL